MNPGIYYFYHYTPHQPTRNVGFLRLSDRQQSLVVDIHIRNIPVRQGDRLQFGAFRTENDSLPIIFLADITAGERNVLATLTIPRSQLSSGRETAEPDGFFLILPDQSALAATAPNVRFEQERLQSPVAMDDSDAGVSIPSAAMDSADAAGNLPAVTQKDIGAAADTPAITKETVNTAADTPAITKETVNAAADIPAITKEDTRAVKADSAVSEEPVSAPENNTVTDRNPSASPDNMHKIKRRDLRVLPRKYWNLANNSFLMHGYRNYNHLLLVEEDGYYLLGVPGIYDIRESHAARLFGFPHFTADNSSATESLAEKEPDRGTFGYWCCHLK